jgi:hypothetical protein
MLEARYEYFYGMQNFTFAMFVACEEGFEMLGNVVFIYGLLSHLGSSMSSLRILVNDQAPWGRWWSVPEERLPRQSSFPLSPSASSFR